VDQAYQERESALARGGFPIAAVIMVAMRVVVEEFLCQD
jgi:hypothetical protein